MNGLVIWAQSDCRSMMGLYRALIGMLKVPVVVAIRDFKVESQRQKTGFRHEEFCDINKTVIGDEYNKGLEILNEHPGFHHIFASYQNAPTYRKLIIEAKRRGESIGVMSEAPCVMVGGVRGLVKDHLYLPAFVRYMIKGVVNAADFVVSLSGDSSMMLQRIGWKPEQIVPFGYFPPPIVGSRVVKRTSNKDFHILVSGIMAWHRAPDTVMRALVLLKKWGVPFRATFTQGGPMLNLLQRMAAEHDLPVTFSGFLPLDALIQLYETCSVYVAAGRREPWGMRLNDALQCGAPIVVSRGMGGVQLVDRYGCGVSFEVDDHVDLACKLRCLIEDEEKYRLVSDNAFTAVHDVSPEAKAKALMRLISARFDEWQWAVST